MVEKIKLVIMIIMVLLLALVGLRQARLEAQIERVDDRVEFTQQRMLYELDLQEKNAQLMKATAQKNFHLMKAMTSKIIQEVK